MDVYSQWTSEMRHVGHIKSANTVCVSCLCVQV